MNILKISVVGLFAALAACTTAPPPRKTVVIAESKSLEASIYRQNCAICHGAEANGKEIDGRLVPSLRFGPAAQKTEQEIYDQIADGKLPMPGFRRQLSEEDIRRMVKFIRRDLQGKED